MHAMCVENGLHRTIPSSCRCREGSFGVEASACRMRFSWRLLTFMTVASGSVESATSLCRRVKLGGSRGRDIWLLALPSRLCMGSRHTRCQVGGRSISIS